MQSKSIDTVRERATADRARWLALMLAGMMSGCGGGGPAIKALAQTIGFQAAPTLTLNGAAHVSATSSSGLPVTYSSATSSVCSVDAQGRVVGVAAGTCIVAADQSGNDEFAPAAQTTQSFTVAVDPAQVIQFARAPNLSRYGSAIVSAVSSSGLVVTYSSRTPGVCAAEPLSGLVAGLEEGTCTIAADQAGDANYHAAVQATLSFEVTAPLANGGVPGQPTHVSATLGSSPATVIVSFAGPLSGGESPLSGYAVVSSPSGITIRAGASPVEVPCPTSCSGYAFSVQASNSFGDGPASAPADVLTNYSVVTTFLEPDTQPKNSIFIGSFTVNTTKGIVADLAGILSESMTGGLRAYPGDDMNWLPLTHQLSSVDDASLGGQLVTTFLRPDTDTLSTNPLYKGSDGWAPGSAMGLYFGFPSANPGNAYVRIFVNPKDPTGPLTPAQRDMLAYADCAPGGMMGGTCMTGTALKGYGTVGSMGGYPIAQVISRK